MMVERIGQKRKRERKKTREYAMGLP